MWSGNVDRRIPADPANPASQEVVESQAGQVWFPDSAFKTATAIRDFNRGENLPLIIFANWRGFSGGTRDMYQEVLKFGAQIVDALVEYKSPVFVYIPPGGELRGGSWVVIDPTINPEQMEFELQAGFVQKVMLLRKSNASARRCMPMLILEAAFLSHPESWRPGTSGQGWGKLSDGWEKPNQRNHRPAAKVKFRAAQQKDRGLRLEFTKRVGQGSLCMQELMHRLDPELRKYDALLEAGVGGRFRRDRSLGSLASAPGVFILGGRQCSARHRGADQSPRGPRETPGKPWLMQWNRGLQL